ncbi:F-box protein [Gossypium australe]|uniref:F-box protein n=1 Tax=Gossypium australe TaxID=47621 RepID=A0A5B6VGB5_9ROSI|nr:F-box protein [Gossypium australe]
MENVDRTSNLPDSILGYILSFLSTKEAVATSILSSKWRYLFALVSNLDFELDESSQLLKISTIKKVLFFHNTANINAFRLRCGKRVDSDRVYGWISAAIRRGVKHLGLSISLDNFTLPGVLFTCTTLITLKLETNLVLNVPKDVCLPNLKILHLKSIMFPNDDSVESLVSSCISLVELIICNCSTKKCNISHNSLKVLEIIRSVLYGSLVIDTPALAYFNYTYCVARKHSLKNLQSLIRADIAFQDIRCDRHQTKATAFFEGISNVNILVLSSTSLKEALTNLPERVPHCILYQLKLIEISGFMPNKDCIGKAKYFLENATVLMKLIIRTVLFLSEEQKSRIYQQLMASPCKSKQCCILVV